MFASDLVVDETLRNEKVAKYRLVKAIVARMSDKNILEVGCGAGTLVRSLKFRNPYNNYFGYDTCDEAIKRANSLADGISYFDKLTDSHRNMFDLIFLVDVLEHVKCPTGFLQVLTTYLKDDGLFVVHVPLEKSGIYQFDSARAVKSLYSEHFSFFDSSDVLQVFKDCKLQIIKKHYHYHFISGFRDFLKYYVLQQKVYRGPVMRMYTRHWCNNIIQSRLVRFAFSLLDWLSYYETKLLSWMSFWSSGITVVATKRINNE
jgi:SAM-dependent methyltransferase